MPVCFGIHLGNSTCCIAVNRDGKISVIANPGGERVTPSMIAFSGDEVVVGLPAKQGIIRHNNGILAGALRALSSSSLEDMVFPVNLKCNLVWEKRKPKYNILVNEKPTQVSAEDFLKHIFEFLKDVAQSHLKDVRLPVVLSLPLWMTGSAISVVHQTASAHGFQVLATISQPAAACLGYGLLDEKAEDSLLLILHCGGTSVTVSVAEVSAGLLSIRESITSPVGGDSLTSVLQTYLAKEFYNRYKGDPLENKRSSRKLYNAAETCKHVLSTMSSSQVNIESLWDGVDFSTQLSRARFDGVIASSLNEMLLPVKEVLQRASVSGEHIGKVVLTGGTCKIPKLQQIVSDMFPNASVLKHLSPDEILALGAACEASFLVGTKRVQGTHTLITSLTKSIFIAVEPKNGGGHNEQLVFLKGTPTHTKHSISMPCPDKESTLVIYEDSCTDGVVSEDQILAQIKPNFDSNGKGALKLDFTLKTDGSLLVKLTETSSKVSKTVNILPEGS